MPKETCLINSFHFNQTIQYSFCLFFLWELYISKSILVLKCIYRNFSTSDVGEQSWQEYCIVWMGLIYWQLGVKSRFEWKTTLNKLLQDWSILLILGVNSVCILGASKFVKIRWAEHIMVLIWETKVPLLSNIPQVWNVPSSLCRRNLKTDVSLWKRIKSRFFVHLGRKNLR